MGHEPEGRQVDPSLQASQGLGSNVAAANETTSHVLVRSAGSHRLARRAGLAPTKPRTVNPSTLIVVAVSWLVGCSSVSVPIPPTYTQDELKAICERQHGWWHPDGLVGGYCEYDSRL